MQCTFNFCEEKNSPYLVKTGWIISLYLPSRINWLTADSCIRLLPTLRAELSTTSLAGISVCWPASVAEAILFSAKGLIFVVKSAANGELLMEKFTWETKLMLSMKQFIYETLLVWYNVLMDIFIYEQLLIPDNFTKILVAYFANESFY